MMTNLRKTVFSATAMALGLVFSAGASAQSTWNLYNGSASNRQGLASGCGQNGTNSGSFNNSYNCTVGTGATQQQATVSAWSANADRGTTGGINGVGGTTGTNTGTKYGAGFELSGSGFASALLSDQSTSGFGGTSRLEAQTAAANGDTTPLAPGSPNHSFDSIAPGSYDMMLLDFGTKSVILNQIGIGWSNGNADLTVLRWTGSTAPGKTTGTSGLAGDGEQNLSSTMYNSANPGTAGWQLVGSYADLGTDNSTPFGGNARNTNATLGSSWWLISAFNTTLNGGVDSCLNSSNANTTCSAANNGFKLNFIATTPGGGGPLGSIPEPTSLALAFVALAGVFGARRHVSKTS